MKCLNRNKVPFYYALFLRKEQSGNGYKPVYGEAVASRANISRATGNASVEQFGTNIEYDRVIYLDDVNCPIDENTILFIDVEPERNDNGDYIYDYIVKKVSRSLNSVSIAISKVKVS